MPAKSFKGSPALQFISQKPDIPDRPERSEERPAVPARETFEEEGAEARYIERRELKTKRVQLLLKPSVHSRIKKLAAAGGVSFNDYVNRVLEREAKDA